jgi:cell division protease FtsH
MTKCLLEWETIDTHQIEDIMSGRPPRPPKPVAPRASTPPSDSGGSRGAEPAPNPVENT